MKSPRPATLVYDGECPFCRASVEWFQERALPGTIEFLSSQSEQRRARFPWLTDEQCNAAMQLVLPDRRTLSGGHALPQLFERLRGWRHIAWLMRLLTTLRLTGPIYRWIARHRHLVSPAVR